MCIGKKRMRSAAPPVLHYGVGVAYGQGSYQLFEHVCKRMRSDTPPPHARLCWGAYGLGGCEHVCGRMRLPPPNNFWGVADVLGVSRTMVLPRGLGVGARICTSPYFACCSKLLQFNSR